MNQTLPALGLVLLVSLSISLLVAPRAIWLGRRLGLADAPGGRRQHGGVIPRLGGLAMYAGFTVAVLGTAVLPGQWLPPRLDPQESLRLAGLLIGGTAAFLFGLLDDRFEFPARPQYLAQFFLALIAIAFIIFIQIVNNPFTDQPVTFVWPVVWALTIFWFMGMINTVNWLDGLDGLAGGVAAILCAFLAVHMLREGQHSVALLPAALFGATLGFLPYNAHPARIFMGSNGSYFLGWSLAALGIIAGAKLATVLLVMGLPILDVAWLIFYRWRRGGKPGVGGRDHLHFRLLDLGLTQRQIVFGYYAYSLLCGALALGIGSRMVKLVALLALTGVALTIMAWASSSADRRLDSKGRGA
jgi:UDP-GlcNAc:undecaprenyl-phosphate/decaprenyl-phosphate GlcNAc-1-phosphate transferase